MLAILYLASWFKRNSNGDPAKGEEDSDASISLETFLANYRIGDDALKVEVAQEVTDYASPDEYLSQHGISENAIAFEEIKAEASHRRQARTVILGVLAVQMLVIPIWLMILLTLPIVNEQASKKISPAMQGAYLAAVATDFAGLYYIITRDLFPKGSNGKLRRKDNEDDEED